MLSLSSCPAISSSNIEASVTFFEKIPAWSKLDAKAAIPHLEHRPYVGFIPTTPQKLAGCLMEPPVSVPVEPKHKSAATAAADPPEEPPGAKGVSWLDNGLIVFPK